MGASTMCVYSREEWLRGFRALGVDTIEKLQKSFDKLKAMLQDENTFRDYYLFCFNFAKEPGFGVRTLRTFVAHSTHFVARMLPKLLL